MCAAPEGILHSSPGTTVDGVTARDGMHVFGGQLLRTPHGQFSDLLTRGTSVRLLSDTKLQFEGDSAELVEGGVALNTSTRFAVHTGCAEITPLAPIPSRYTVQRQQKTVYVTANESDVTVRAKKTVRVGSGKTVAVYCAAAGEDIVFVGASNLAADVAMGVGGAAAGAAPFIKPDMSSGTLRH